nr:hypothetical protein [Tanacetum cinerariifolium]
RYSREQGCRIVGVELVVAALTKRIAKLERDNKRLRGTVRVSRLEACARKHMDTVLRYAHWKMPNTRSGASMTQEEVEELVTRRVAEEIEARKAAINLKPLNENEDEQEGDNEGRGNGGNAKIEMEEMERMEMEMEKMEMEEGTKMEIKIGIMA